MANTLADLRPFEPAQVPTRRWIPDDARDACVACGTTFSFTRRRHHCRYCGDVFCSKCAVSRGKAPPARCCTPCRAVVHAADSGLRRIAKGGIDAAPSNLRALATQISRASPEPAAMATQTLDDSGSSRNLQLQNLRNAAASHLERLADELTIALRGDSPPLSLLFAEPYDEHPLLGATDSDNDDENDGSAAGSSLIGSMFASTHTGAASSPFATPPFDGNIAEEMRAAKPEDDTLFGHLFEPELLTVGALGAGRRTPTPESTMFGNLFGESHHRRQSAGQSPAPSDATEDDTLFSDLFGPRDVTRPAAGDMAPACHDDDTAASPMPLDSTPPPPDGAFDHDGDSAACDGRDPCSPARGDGPAFNEASQASQACELPAITTTEARRESSDESVAHHRSPSSDETPTDNHAHDVHQTASASVFNRSVTSTPPPLVQEPPSHAHDDHDTASGQSTPPLSLLFADHFVAAIPPPTAEVDEDVVSDSSSTDDDANDVDEFLACVLLSELCESIFDAVDSLDVGRVVFDVFAERCRVLAASVELRIDPAHDEGDDEPSNEQQHLVLQRTRRCFMCVLDTIEAFPPRDKWVERLSEDRTAMRSTIASVVKLAARMESVVMDCIAAFDVPMFEVRHMLNGGKFNFAAALDTVVEEVLAEVRRQYEDLGEMFIAPFRVDFDLGDDDHAAKTAGRWHVGRLDQQSPVLLANADSPTSTDDSHDGCYWPSVVGRLCAGMNDPENDEAVDVIVKPRGIVTNMSGECSAVVADGCFTPLSTLLKSVGGLYDWGSAHAADEGDDAAEADTHDKDDEARLWLAFQITEVMAKLSDMPTIAGDDCCVDLSSLSIDDLVVDEDKETVLVNLLNPRLLLLDVPAFGADSLSKLQTVDCFGTLLAKLFEPPLPPPSSPREPFADNDVVSDNSHHQQHVASSSLHSLNNSHHHQQHHHHDQPQDEDEDEINTDSSDDHDDGAAAVASSSGPVPAPLSTAATIAAICDHAPPGVIALVNACKSRGGHARAPPSLDAVRSFLGSPNAETLLRRDPDFMDYLPDWLQSGAELVDVFSAAGSESVAHDSGAASEAGGDDAEINDIPGLLRLIARKPKVSDNYVQLASLLEAGENVSVPGNSNGVMDARKLLLRAIALNPANAQALLELAMDLDPVETIAIKNIGQVDRRKLLKLAIGADPECSDAHFELAAELDPGETLDDVPGFGLHTDARRLLRAAIDLNDEHSDAYLHLALQLEEDETVELPGFGECTDRDLLIRAIEVDTENSDALHELALILGRTELVSIPGYGRVSRRNLLVRAMELDPLNPDICTNLAEALRADETVLVPDVGDVGRRELYARAVELDPNSKEGFTTLADHLTEDEYVTISWLGSVDRRGLIAKAIEFEPGDAVLLLRLAMYLDNDEALHVPGIGQATNKQILLRVIELQPSWSHAYSALGDRLGLHDVVAVSQRGALNRRQLYLLAIEVEPTNVAAHVSLADSLSPGETVELPEIGTVTERELLLRAADLDHNSSVALFALARRLKRGETIDVPGLGRAGVRRLLSHVIRLSPGLSTAYRYLAHLLTRGEAIDLAKVGAMTARQLLEYADRLDAHVAGATA